MIKLILIIFIIVCSVLIGIGIKNHLQNRLDIFRDFKDLIKNISGEITFLKTDKYTMLKNQHLKNKHSNQFLNDYLVLGKGELSILKSHENKELNNFLNSIGKKDVDGEIYNLNYYENLIEKNYTLAETNYNKYGVFSIKMSILFGVLLAIILI